MERSTLRRNRHTAAHTPTTTTSTYPQPGKGSCKRIPFAFSAFSLCAATHIHHNLHPTNLAHISGYITHVYKDSHAPGRLPMENNRYLYLCQQPPTSASIMHALNTYLLRHLGQFSQNESQIRCTKRGKHPAT